MHRPDHATRIAILDMLDIPEYLRRDANNKALFMFKASLSGSPQATNQNWLPPWASKS